MFNIEEYDYDLPENLIAQVPAVIRDKSRLLVTDRSSESLHDHFFSDLPGLLKPGDLLVVNNTKVIPARIYGRKESGGEKMKKLTHIEAIRLISGMFRPENAVNILAFINLVARNNLGLAEDDFTDEQMKKLDIKLVREIEVKCPDCGCTEMLCGHNGPGCQAGKND